MKKISLFVTAALFSTALFAQAPAKFGLKAGVNFNTLNINDAAAEKTLSNRTGFHVGGLAHIHLAPEWAIQPEVQYSSQGAKQTLNNREFDWKLNYLNVPVMVQYMFDNGFRIEAGPQVGFLLNSKIEDQNGNESSLQNDLKKTDISLGVGLNYLTYSGIGIGGRYNFGVSNINDNSNSNDINNRVFQVSLFYMFDNAHKAKSR